jgi:hypothetical protein
MGKEEGGRRRPPQRVAPLLGPVKQKMIIIPYKGGGRYLRKRLKTIDITYYWTLRHIRNKFLLIQLL